MFWHVHGSFFYVRNNSGGKRMMAAWFGMRCGFKDQYSLWHATLTLAKESGCLPYEGEVYRFLNYYEARKVSTFHKYKHLLMNCTGRTARCPKFRFCMKDAPLESDLFVHHSFPAKNDLFVHHSIPANRVATFTYRDDGDHSPAEEWNFTVQNKYSSAGHIIAELGLSSSIIAENASPACGLLPDE